MYHLCHNNLSSKKVRDYGKKKEITSTTKPQRNRLSEQPAIFDNRRTNAPKHRRMHESHRGVWGKKKRKKRRTSEGPTKQGHVIVPKNVRQKQRPGGEHRTVEQLRGIVYVKKKEAKEQLLKS